MTAVLTHRIGLRLGRSQSIEDSEQKKCKTPDLFLFGNGLKFHPVGFTFWTIHIFTSLVADEVVCYISTQWGEYEKIKTGFDGRIIEICAQQGAYVNKGDVIAYIQRDDVK